MMKRKICRKVLLWAMLLSGCLPITLQAAQDGRIVTTDGKVIRTHSIKAGKDGALEYASPDGKTTLQIPRERYQYAWIPKPAEIIQADQQYKNMKYESAGSLYRKCASTFKLLGWEAYCLRMEGACLAKTGKKAAAEQHLKKLRQIRLLHPESREELILAEDLLCDLLIDNRKYDEALQILKKQIRLDHKDLVFSAFFKQAVILQNTNKRLEAAKAFYHTALLFPGHERRSEALYNAWSLFTELKDQSAVKIADLMKKQYPDDPYTKRIFQ